MIRELHVALLRHNPEAQLFIQTTHPTDGEIAKCLDSLDNGASMRYVDLAPVWKSLASSVRTLGFDTHWGAAMNRAVSETLFDLLRRSESR